MDFLQPNGAILDMRTSAVPFSTKEGIAKNDSEVGKAHTLRLVYENVMVPSRSTIVIALKGHFPGSCEWLVEVKVNLLLERNVSVVRSVVRLHDCYGDIVLTNHHRVPAHVCSIKNAFTVGTNCKWFAPKRVAKLTSISLELSVGQKQKLTHLLKDFCECFATSSKVRQTPVAKSPIIVDETTKPIHQHPYSVSYKEREAIRNPVKGMLQDEVIQSPTSPWASSVVLVEMKDKTLCFCVDYRKLKRVRNRKVDSLTTRWTGCEVSYFLSLDLKSAHWQIAADERESEKTALVTPGGLHKC